LKIRTARAVLTPWLCRKTKISRTLLFGPGGQNARGTNRPDAIDLA
jgi:hypothetical protein